MSIEILGTHIHQLATVIGPRNVYDYRNLEAARSYIRQTWLDQGYRVETQKYLIPSEFCRNKFIPAGIADDLEVANLKIRIPGIREPEKIIIIGAHYDSVKNCPGANDNASSVAVLLELSRALKEIDFKPNKTVDLIAFTNEEPPFFRSILRGSFRSALASKLDKENIIAMIALDSIGYYNHQEGSQHSPFPLNLWYGNKGNFVAFVSNLRSARLTTTSIDKFRQGSSLAARQLSLPTIFVPQIGFSDHSSYWRSGYPAFLITDTAMFRYPHYHQKTDTSDKLDYPKLHRITDGLVSILQKLAS